MNERFVSVQAFSAIAIAGLTLGLFGGLTLATIFWVYGVPILAVVSVLLGVGVFVRSLLIRFEIRPSRVLVRNYFRSSTIDSTEVDRFGWRTLTVGFGPSLILLPSLAIKLRGGGVVVASATGGMKGEKAERLLRAVSDFAATHNISVELKTSDLRTTRAVDLKSSPL